MQSKDGNLFYCVVLMGVLEALYMNIKELMEGKDEESEIQMEKAFWSSQIALIW